MSDENRDRLTLIKMVYDNGRGWVHEGEPLAVPINPSELSFSTDLPAHSAASPATATSQAPTANVSRKLSLNLLLDTYEAFYGAAPSEANSVYTKYVAPLESMTKRDASGMPPVVLVTWNQKKYIETSDTQGAKFDKSDDRQSSFFGVISSLSIKYSLFHTDGTPLRGTANLSFTEASLQSMNQAK